MDTLLILACIEHVLYLIPMSHNMEKLVKSTNHTTDPFAFAENLNADNSTNFAKAAHFSTRLI